MKKIACFTIGVTLSSLALHAQETPEQVVKRMVDLGPGVQDVKVEGGKLKSLKVVGQERITTVLGKAKGLQVAQKRATLKANAEFVEWMKKNVSSINTLGDETIVAMAGNGGQVTEQGKSSETTKQEITTKAEGLVRGLTLVAKDQDPETEMLTLVFSWSPQKAAVAEQAGKINDDPSAAAPATGAEEKSKEVHKKTVVSPDFDE